MLIIAKCEMAGLESNGLVIYKPRSRPAAFCLALLESALTGVIHDSTAPKPLYDCVCRAKPQVRLVREALKVHVLLY